MSAVDLRELAQKARELAADADAMDIVRLLDQLAEELEEEAYELEKTRGRSRS